MSGAYPLGYTTLVGGEGITVTPGTNTLTFGVGNALKDSSGNTLLGLASGGVSSPNHLQVSSSISTAAPSLAAIGSGAVALDLEDAGGAGVNLTSNAAIAPEAVNAATGYASYVTANGAPAGLPVIIGAASSGGSGDISLQLQPQNNGSVISTANVDTKANALIAEIAANPMGFGVTADALVVLSTNNDGQGADFRSGTPNHGIIGVAVNSVDAMTAGTAQVAYSGIVNCHFDSSGIAFNHYVVTGTLGQCHDSTVAASGTPPTSPQVIGISLGAGGSHTNVPVLLRIVN